MECRMLAAKLAPEYGIDYRTPIFAIHKNGHYGSIVGRGFADIKEFHQTSARSKRGWCRFYQDYDDRTSGFQQSWQE